MWKSDHPMGEKGKGTIVPSFEDAKRETIAQLERHKELTGSYPNHFEGHSMGNENTQHAFREIMKEKRIHGMCQEEEDELLYYGHELIMGNEAYMKALHIGITAEQFMDDICGILSSPYEYNIVHFHPGYLDAYVIDHSTLTIPRVRDVQTLTDPRVRNGSTRTILSWWISEPSIKNRWEHNSSKTWNHFQRSGQFLSEEMVSCFSSTLSMCEDLLDVQVFHAIGRHCEGKCEQPVRVKHQYIRSESCGRKAIGRGQCATIQFELIDSKHSNSFLIIQFFHYNEAVY
jgi:hypothetical protein